MIDLATAVRYLFWLAVAISVIGTLLLPLLAIRIPVDYFSRPTTLDHSAREGRVGLRAVSTILRNTLAIMLFAAGIVMLFTPGQGLLMLLVALWLANFPGKRNLERRLVSIPGVLMTIDKIRAKGGKPPLQMPSADTRNASCR